MAATLPGGQRDAALRQGGQAHAERWTPPHHSAGQQQPAYSRCAAGGTPRVLPRGIGGQSCPTLNDIHHIFFWRPGELRNLPDITPLLPQAEYFGFELLGHFDLLGFGSLRATHDQIIEHHAPIVKNFLQKISKGDSKPSNAGIER